MLTPVLAQTLEAFLSVFSSSAVSAVVLFVVFCLARLRFRSFFTPRAADPSVEVKPPGLGRGVLGWVRRLLAVTEEQVLETAGMDALMYMKFVKLCCRLFFGMTLFALAVVLPVNTTGGNGIHDSINRFSMANIQVGSSRLWAHVVAAYALSFYLMWGSYRAYHDMTAVAQKHHVRHAEPELFTVLVREIPEDHRTDEDVAAFYEHFFPGQVVSASVARDYTEAQALVDQRTAAKKELAHALGQLRQTRKRPTHKPALLPGPLSIVPVSNLLATSVDSVDFYRDAVARIDAALAKERARPHAPLPAAFVSFRTCEAAHKASQVWIANEGWHAEMAPAPADVYFPNLRLLDRERSVRRLLSEAASFWLIVSWAILTTAITAFTTVEHLEKEAHWLKTVFDYNSTLRAFLTGFLPTLALILLMSLLPAIFERFAREEGITSHSEMERRSLERLYFVYVVNVFFVTLIAGSVMTALKQIIDNPTGIARLLGEAVPLQATSFMNYTVMSGLGGFPIELLRPVPLMLAVLLQRTATTNRERRAAEDPGEIWYGYLVFPSQLLIMTLGMTYSVIQPLILPFTLGFFLIAYVVWLHQVTQVYRARPDTGGKMWPIVFSRIMYGLFIFQFTLIGVVGLKYGIKESPVLAPLPAITLLFFMHCHEKFRKSFQVLPLQLAAQLDAERLAKGEFGLGFLDGAYDHPAASDEREAHGAPGDGDDPILRALDGVPRVSPPVLDGGGEEGGGGGGEAAALPAAGAEESGPAEVDWDALDAADEDEAGNYVLPSPASVSPQSAGGDGYQPLT